MDYDSEVAFWYSYAPPSQFSANVESAEESIADGDYWKFPYGDLEIADMEYKNSKTASWIEIMVKGIFVVSFLLILTTFASICLGMVFGIPWLLKLLGIM